MLESFRGQCEGAYKQTKLQEIPWLLGVFGTKHF